MGARQDAILSKALQTLRLLTCAGLGYGSTHKESCPRCILPCGLHICPCQVHGDVTPFRCQHKCSFQAQFIAPQPRFIASGENHPCHRNVLAFFLTEQNWPAAPGIIVHGYQGLKLWQEKKINPPGCIHNWCYLHLDVACHASQQVTIRYTPSSIVVAGM